MERLDPTTTVSEQGLNAPQLIGADSEAFRAALQRVIDSEAFAGSRRMSAFLQFVGQAALEGRTEIDQYEIAEQVLHRHDDFNPLDDASVRKLASQVRSKLEEYAESEGSSDPAVIVLPRRSYVPRFRYRNAGNQNETLVETTAMPEPSPEVTEPPLQKTAFWWQAKLSAHPQVVLAIVAFAMLLPLAGYWLGKQNIDAPAVVQDGSENGIPPAIVIHTQRGDLRGVGWDASPGSVQLGPVLDSGHEVTVELDFTSERATQQAGLMAFGDPDNFVRFGHHFKDRTMLEQSYEIDGNFHTQASNYRFDSLGQFGRPRWLSLRREGNEYLAFLSTDGLQWAPFGPPMEVAGLPSNPRAAIYAFNGRSDGPSADATFRDFRVGPAFHDRKSGPFDAAEFRNWSASTTCPEDARVRLEDGGLEIGYPPAVVGCHWRFTQPVPGGDWTYQTLMDFVPVSGSYAGMEIRGDKSNVQLSRRRFQINILSLERSVDNDMHLADFPGSPLVILQLENRGGMLTASASRDGVHFVKFDEAIPLSDLGENLQLGIFAAVAHWTSEASRPPARFHWIQQTVTQPDFVGRSITPEQLLSGAVGGSGR
jgi:hypothetical protein